MLSTSLQLKKEISGKTWQGYGVVIGQSEDTKGVEEEKKHHTFFKEETSSYLKCLDPHGIIKSYNSSKVGWVILIKEWIVAWVQRSGTRVH